jgi:transposase
MVSRKPHPAELRERAVNMVFELRAETGNARGSIARVGQRLGINTGTLRNWVNKAEVDSGQRPGITTEDKKRIAELKREVRELRLPGLIRIHCSVPSPMGPFAEKTVHSFRCAVSMFVTSVCVVSSHRLVPAVATTW